MKAELLSDDDDDEFDPKLAQPASTLKRGRKSLKTPDSAECFRTRGPGKGERSFKLAEDLFSGRHIDFIYVCHTCYMYFDTEKKLSMHKDGHPKGGTKGEYHTYNSKEFQCPKCSELILVKHLVWFIKHLKYCGEDDQAAQVKKRFCGFSEKNREFYVDFYLFYVEFYFYRIFNQFFYTLWME